VIGRYLMRCANKTCEARRRTGANPLRDGWPEHCGEAMVFATTFDEERFGREALQSGAVKFDLEDAVKLVDS
jgi:hypothetical protein